MIIRGEIMSIGKIIKDLREQKGMTLDEVAEACGLGICIPNGMLRDFAAARQESS